MEESLWSKIDRKRGDLPRSRFIARILADSLENQEEDRNQ